jgi:hypothetical protein
MHLGVGAALDQEGVFAPTDQLEAAEEVQDELDLEVVDPLKGHVSADGALVARTRRSQRHHGYCQGCLIF